MTQQLDRSAIFTAYNLARPMARQGLIDGKRLNRALGVAMRREPVVYMHDLDHCACPDRSGIDASGRRFKPAATYPCKHMLARMLRTAAGISPKEAA